MQEWAGWWRKQAIMVALSLKIGVGNVMKTMQFEPSTMVYDACRIIRERVPEAQLGQREWDPEANYWANHSSDSSQDFYCLKAY